MKVTASLKYKVLSLILFPVLITIGFVNYDTWSHSHVAGQSRARNAASGSANASKVEPSMPSEAGKSAPPPETYGLIAERNIFNPERKEFPAPAVTPAEAPKPVVRPQVTLSGVVISDDYQAAFISSPGSGILKPGDKLGDYRLASISADRITLEAGGDSFEVLLYDRKKRTRPEASNSTQVADAKTSEPASAPPAASPAKFKVIQTPQEKTERKPVTTASLMGKWNDLRSNMNKAKAMRQSFMDASRRNTAAPVDATENRNTTPALETAESK